ncbi:MAG: ABC transporter permease [Chloroflexi bacterium]|nr:ABC transporter permease [Chloroflexota bacterium]
MPWRYIVGRVLWVFPVLVSIGLITFVLMHNTPGGPWDREKPLDPRVVENLNRKFGLDRPLHEQFVSYMWNALRLDLGPSYQYRGRSVTDIIAERLPMSIQLGVLALAVSLLLAVPLGMLAALRQNTWLDYTSLFFATIGVTVPSFVMAIFLIMVFGVWLSWLPVMATNWGDWRAWLLPTLTLALFPTAFIARLTRASMLEAIRQDYVRTARAKGLAERIVVTRHALRNALLPVVTVVGPATAGLITGSFFVETMFSFPGIGRLFVQAVSQRDYSVIMGTTLLYAALIAFANLVVDVAYGFVDPRIKAEG